MHCTACGKANQGGRFCTGCGAHLPAQAVATPAPAMASPMMGQPTPNQPHTPDGHAPHAPGAAALSAAIPAKFSTSAGPTVSAPAPVQPVLGGPTLEMRAQEHQHIAETHAQVIERSAPARGAAPEAFLQLHPSEQAVVHAASRIFAAHVAAGRVSDDNQAEIEERSVRAAIRIAVLTDRLVQSDDEEW